MVELLSTSVNAEEVHSTVAGLPSGLKGISGAVGKDPVTRNRDK